MYQVALLVFLLSMNALAHPVIYQDGIVASSANMPSYSENYFMYSYTSKWAAGLGHWRFVNEDDKTTQEVMVKLNHLLWRKNGEDYQANIYLHGGLGTSAMTGVEGDWETRTLYTSLKHYEFRNNAVTQARVGVSPRLSGYKDLQSWIMLQGMYNPFSDKTVMITPLVRFFYHNFLWEVGSSLKGEWLVNLMVHY